MQVPLRKLWRFVCGWSCGRLTRIAPQICRSPQSWDVTVEPWECGEPASSSRAWRACRTLRGRAGRGDFPPSERVDVVSIATSDPSDYGCPATRWSLDDIAAAILNQAHAQAMSRSTVFRILDEADLKPHRSVYWLNSHDPDFEAKAREICGLYVDAPRLYEQGRLLICTDEKTGMQILERKYPTKRAEPGHPERREQEYIRHGTRVLTGSFVVPTGELVWDVGQTRTSLDFAAHLQKVAEHFPRMQGFDWVLDNLNTHWSLDVCEVVARLSEVAFEPKKLKTGAQRRAFLTDPSHKHVFHFSLSARHARGGAVGSSHRADVRLSDGKAEPSAARLSRRRTLRLAGIGTIRASVPTRASLNTEPMASPAPQLPRSGSGGPSPKE